MSLGTYEEDFILAVCAADVHLRDKLHTGWRPAWHEERDHPELSYGMKA